MPASYPSGIGELHERYVHSRRVAVLARELLRMLPASGTVLDVGCGDGRLAAAIQRQRPALEIVGVDVLVRPASAIPVRAFDGRSLPFGDGAFDVVLCVDVLHHADAPEALLRELARCGRRIVLKDHTRDGWLAGATLRLMDWVGNARHGVSLPYTYWSTSEWREVLPRAGLRVDAWQTRIPLYPPPASWIFGRRLHFIAALSRAAGSD